MIRAGSSLTSVLILMAAVIPGCSQQRVIFHAEPVVWELNDDSHVDCPAKRSYNRFAYTVDVYLNRQFDDLIDPVDPPLAMNVNALDEVPNSSWFTNRMGSRRLTRQEVAAGPGGEKGSPQSAFPWLVTELGGTDRRRHIRVEDNAGRLYTLTFDSPGSNGAFTASEVVASRILYAAGYNVSENYIVHFRPGDLLIGAATPSTGTTVTEDALEGFLSMLVRNEDGTFRALAVRDFDGIDCGVFPMAGTRRDDPNDLIPHEHRRELRALRVFCAWLDHVDVTPDNGADIYVEDEDGSHLRHYLTAFDDCFGSYFLDNPLSHPGFEYGMIDMAETVKDVMTLGLAADGWEKIGRSAYAFAGPYFESGQFDPGRWKPIHPVPYFSQITPQDVFWAAKIIAVFGDDHLNGAIEQSMVSPSSEQYILDILKRRRQAILEWAFSEVGPLDDFTLEFKRQGLVFDFMNLAEKYAIVSGDDLEYGIRVMDGEYQQLVKITSRSFPQYVLPDRGLDLSGENNYVVIEVRSTDRVTGRVSPAVRAHFHGGKQAGFTLIGIERDS